MPFNQKLNLKIMKKSNRIARITAVHKLDYLEEKEFSYPLYPSNEDVYEKSRIESEIDPVNPDKNKEDEEKFIPFDLDIPGTELDDEDETIGAEDEENNYYSIGGDRHNDLDETQ